MENVFEQMTRKHLLGASKFIRDTVHHRKQLEGNMIKVSFIKLNLGMVCRLQKIVEMPKAFFIMRIERSLLRW